MDGYGSVRLGETAMNFSNLDTFNQTISGSPKIYENSLLNLKPPNISTMTELENKAADETFNRL